MEKLYQIKEALMEELKQMKVAKTGELKGAELEALHKLTDTIKNIDKICMFEDEGHSQGNGGEWEADMRGSYSGRHRNAMGQFSSRNSYADGGQGGSYRSGRRGNSRNSYENGNSYGGGREEIMEHLDALEASAGNEQERRLIRQFRGRMENL